MRRFHAALKLLAAVLLAVWFVWWTGRSAADVIGLAPALEWALHWTTSGSWCDRFLDYCRVKPDSVFPPDPVPNRSASLVHTALNIAETAMLVGGVLMPAWCSLALVVNRTRDAQGTRATTRQQHESAQALDSVAKLLGCVLPRGIRTNSFGPSAQLVLEEFSDEMLRFHRPAGLNWMWVCLRSHSRLIGNWFQCVWLWLSPLGRVLDGAERRIMSIRRAFQDSDDSNLPPCS